MFIRVADETKQHFETVEIPVDNGLNGSVSLTTLAAQFPDVSALKYRHSETNTWRGVRVVDDKLYHPDGIWDLNTIYITVYSKQNVEQQEELIDENDPNRRCVDLIVLGISYRSIEADVKKCFEAFGGLIFCEIKRDAKGQSRGFGFIRFKNYDSQLAVINKRHFIDGRYVDVKIPDSKTNIQEPECARKIFVARLPDNITPDDLRQYFSKYGAIKDVYIPKPARSFAFVTFHDSNIVRTLFGTHTINGCSVTVGPAEPKTKSSTMTDYSSMNYKRVKPDHHNTLRTLTPYGVSSTYSVYGHSPNADMIHPYYQQYNINPADSTRAVFSDNQQTYWGNTHDERAAAAWQQQYYQ